MDAFSLRDALISDAAEIVAIWNPIIRDTAITFNPLLRSAEDIAAMIAERQAAGHAVMLAEKAGIVLGFGAYAQFRSGLGYARTMEHTINLAPEARGLGVGRALLMALEDHATRAGHHVMVAAISETNSGSIGFHAALGYREVGRMQEVGWKFERYHDLVLMQKFLGVG